MDVCTSEDRPAQLAGPLLQHLDTDLHWSQNKTEFSDSSAKARSCTTFGNFPAYYRARRDFRASCRKEAVATSDFQQFQKALDSVFGPCCPSESSKGLSNTVSGIPLEDGRPTFFGTTGERLVVDPSLLYDLDWRLGSVAEYDKEIFVGKDVLDLGCNTGKISFIVASLMQARSVLGADIDATLICRARAELRRLQHRYGRIMPGNYSARLSPRQRFISKATGKTAATLRSNELLAELNTREERTRFFMPLAVRCTKRKSLSSSVSPSAGETHEGSIHSKKEARNCRWVLSPRGAKDALLRETVPCQSSCVDTSATTATRPEGPRHEGVLNANDPRMTGVPGFRGRQVNAKVTPSQNVEATEIEGSVRRDVTGRGHGISFTSRKVAASRGLRSDEASHFSSGPLVGYSVDGTINEMAHCRAELPDHRTTHRKTLSDDSRPAIGRSEFPYNISFCVADAVCGRPWRLPTICRNTCDSDRDSAACFCGLTGEICEQQAQLSLAAPEGTKTDFCGKCFEQECVQINYGTIHSPFEWEKLKEAFDVVICFSLTKWIHLHHGDKGILLLFARLHALLKGGGLLLLEPQDWASYRRARRMCASFKSQLKCIRLSPRIFCSILTRNRACSCSGELLLCGGELSRKNCRAHREEISGRLPELQCSSNTSDLRTAPCPSHACPFGLLAMLRPWSDLEKSRAKKLLEGKVTQASTRCANSLRYALLPLCSQSHTWRSSVLNSSAQKRISEKGCIQVLDRSPPLQTGMANPEGEPFTAQDEAAIICQGCTDKCCSSAFRVDEEGNLLQKDTDGDETSSSERGVDSGQPYLPLPPESVSLCPHLLRYQRHFVLNDCGSEGYNGQDSSVNSVVLEARVKTLNSECSRDQCGEMPKKNNLHVGLVHEGSRGSRRSSWETSQLNFEGGRASQAYTSQGRGGPGEDDAIHIKGPAGASSEPHCCSEVRETYTGAVTETKKSILQECAKTWEERDSSQGMQNSQVERLNKSEGTLGHRFVYVLQKLSTDFTLCCKQLQECAHAKAACGATRLN